mmetsp:Transcript_13636/g.37884  ORF Transcript_13636/g.37884 Transcript_13636/m.37884 type:complete len:310 (+) Transcript_13636:202-1131(+)
MSRATMPNAALARSASIAEMCRTGRVWHPAVRLARCQLQGRRAGTLASGKASMEGSSVSGAVARPHCQCPVEPDAAGPAPMAIRTSAGRPWVRMGLVACNREHPPRSSCRMDVVFVVRGGCAPLDHHTKLAASGHRATLARAIQTRIRLASRRTALSMSHARHRRAMIADFSGRECAVCAQNPGTSPRKILVSARRATASPGGGPAHLGLARTVPTPASRAAWGRRLARRTAPTIAQQSSIALHSPPCVLLLWQCASAQRCGGGRGVVSGRPNPQQGALWHSSWQTLITGAFSCRCHLHTKTVRPCARC